MSFVLHGQLDLVAAASGAGAPIEADRFEKEAVVSGLDDPVEMAVLDDGRIVVAERYGRIRLYDPRRQQTIELGQIPSHIHIELGMCGMAPAPDFASSGHLYVTYSSESERDALRISRFTVVDEAIDLDSECILVRIPVDYDVANHMGGGMAFDSQGNLLIGLGDNSPPIPEVPIDTRPGKHLHDSQRSAANSRDYRGKVLRIHPEPDGSYSIPPGNLFPEGRDGLPEIYVMGCRNPFRVQVDTRTDWLYWGDVGPNVIPEAKMGPTGYDEINQAKAAGNFGWPMFVGPNEAYSELDFETRVVGRPFDPEHPVNRSPNNTGIRDLPPAMPALIWYPSEPSSEFPELGSGGRSAIAGPVYYYAGKQRSNAELPAEYDRTLFICEWMRNWIKAVRLDADGRVRAVEPFCNHLEFRRPIDLRLGPEGALYVLEYGDRWDGNRDAQVTRIVYRAGNRTPIARLTATPTAGKEPLTAQLDGSQSYDKDAGDTLAFHWSAETVQGGQVSLSQTGEQQAEARFAEPGIYRIQLRVTDALGASAAAQETIYVGNSRPEVRFDDLAMGGFFDWEEPVGYSLSVTDLEDGVVAEDRPETGTPGDPLAVASPGSAAGSPAISPEFVSTLIEYQPRRIGLGEGELDPAEALMRKSTCFGCHAVAGQSKGPSYRDVSKKYEGRPNSLDLLAKKVQTGGAGVWGAYPMPPHPQHTLEQTRLMAEWVLGQSEPTGPISMLGLEGGFLARLPRFDSPDGGVFVLTAGYTDRGYEGLPPLRGEATAVLHARRKRAALHDFARGPLVVHELDGERAQFLRLGDKDYFGFADMNLAGIDRLRVRAGHLGRQAGALEFHVDQPKGPLLGTLKLVQTGWYEQELGITPPAGQHDLVIVGQSADHEPSLQVNWIQFLESPAAAAARRGRHGQIERRIAAAAERAKPRAFVNNWSLDDLAPLADKLASGRSFERGKALFSVASCSTCHQIAGQGGRVGPDLTEIAQRMAKRDNPRLAMLTEILDPSRVVDEKYRTQVILTHDGQRLAGVVLEETADYLRLAANPARPDEVRRLDKSAIDERHESPVSLMPVGLLNALSADEILDLAAYLESGGKIDHPAFRP